MTHTTTTETFQTWAVVELLGRRRLAGWVSEATIAGGGFVRLDVPFHDDREGFEATQYYSPGAIYAMTPTTEETARRVAKLGRVEPVARWELPSATVARRWDDEEPDSDGDEDGEPR